MIEQQLDGDSVAIRLARADEASLIVALIHRAFEQYRGELQPEPSALSMSIDKVGAAIAEGIVLVAHHGDRLIGCVAIQHKDGFAYTGRLAVDPAARGRGIGRALMAQAEVMARGMSATRLRVDVRLALAGNRAFFRSLGFAEGEHRCHPGFARPTYVELEKILV